MRHYEPSGTAGAAKETQEEEGSITGSEQNFAKSLCRTKPEAKNVLEGFYFRNFATGFCRIPFPLPSPGFPHLHIPSSDWQLLLRQRLSHFAVPALPGDNAAQEGAQPVSRGDQNRKAQPKAETQHRGRAGGNAEDKPPSSVGFEAVLIRFAVFQPAPPITWNPLSIPLIQQRLWQ